MPLNKIRRGPKGAGTTFGPTAQRTTHTAAPRAAHSAGPTAPAGHTTVTPSILYFGTPVVPLSTENENGTFNLAPTSSAWALGQTVVLGLGTAGQTGANLAARPGLMINLPGPHLWPSVERLAPLTAATRCRNTTGERSATSRTSSPPPD